MSALNYQQLLQQNQVSSLNTCVLTQLGDVALGISPLQKSPLGRLLLSPQQTLLKDLNLTFAFIKIPCFVDPRGWES